MNDYCFVIPRVGGPEVLVTEPVDPAARPGPGEARVRHRAIGVNFIDIYFRAGVNRVAALPSGIGLEAAGVIEAVGAGVDFVAPGDRVGYATGALGAYATVRVMPADLLIPLPDWLDDATAAGSLTKGLTAQMLVEQCARVRPGQTALVHAAAGGVGSLLVQWLKAVGATVVAHAGSEAKAARARSLGADDALWCAYADLPGEVRRVTHGRRADVVFDGVGAASWAASLKSVARTGLIASFGNASGQPPPITTRQLSENSIFVTRPNTYQYNFDRERRWSAAARVFDMLRSGALRVDVAGRFALADAPDAHRAIEARRTIGSTVLIP